MPKDLKNKSFANIQELFDKAMKRVNTFVDMDTDLVEGSEVRAEGSKTREESSSKRAGDELEQENAKKQKIDDDQEAAKRKELIKKSMMKRKVDGSSRRYSAFIQMLRSFDREDLETLWKLVKAKHSVEESTRKQNFDNGLHIEINEVKMDFNQMEAAVEQYVMNIVMHVNFVTVNVLPANNKYLVHDNLEIECLEPENDHLFELLLSQDIVQICVNSLATRNECCEMQQSYIHEYNENLVLKAELAKKEHMINKKFFDEVVLRCSRLENHNVNLENKSQHQKESFLNNRTMNNQNSPAILEFFKINEWQTKLDIKDVSIANLKKYIKSLKGKNVVENDVRLNNPNVIAPRMFKLDLAPLAPKLLNNKDAHIDYIKHSREHADTLQEIVKHAKALRPLDSDLESYNSNNLEPIQN
ncbi:hypothetical protein Tco_1022555 [Tanacetum coccineum]